MNIFKSLKFALNGILYVIKNERNMRFHMVISVYVFVFSLFFSMSTWKYVVLMLIISSVMILEMLNSSLENLVDLCSKEYNTSAKIAKDIAAGAVLVMCFVSVIIGLIFFTELEAYVRIWFFVCKYPVVIILFVIFSYVSCEYVFLGPTEIKNKLKKIVYKFKNRTSRKIK